jgi:PST family polysaccharide transporter
MIPPRSGVEDSEGHEGSHPSSSYREALKATSITGATSVVEVLLRMVKSKVIAVVVGPGGIGMFGVLSSATGLVSTLVGLGITGSGVRQVAAAAGDQAQVARVTHTLRRTSVILGLIGTAVVLLLATPIARVAAGSAEYAGYLMLLAPLIFFTTVSGGQTALLRGLRQIATLARLKVIGVFFGTLFALPFVLKWGLDGIAPAMLMTAAVILVASWWYARQVEIPSVSLSAREFLGELRGLVGLGAVFLLTGLQATGIEFLLRTILLHQTDLATVGQFLAAAALSHVYVNFILQAMGMDYLPRLTRVKDDPVACNRLVNEQSEVALLLAGAGIVALTVLAPLLIPLLYSGRFAAAIEVFRWQCLGVLLKVASWPIGFVLIAKGMRTTFLVTETST